MTLIQLSPWANHLWQSTLCAAVAVLVTLVLRRNRAAVRYGLWFAVSVKFLVPFSLLMSAGTHLGWRTAPTIERSQIPIVMDEISRPFAAPALAGRAKEPSSREVPEALLFGVWLCGFTVAAAVWLRWWWQIHTIRRAATPLDLHLPIPVMSSGARLEPGVFGIRKPVLLLPAGITDRLSPEQLRAVLEHELCHVRRRDNLTGAIHMLVEAVFWFHPLVWWIGWRLLDERERACDEEVLSTSNDPDTYAQGILNVCKLYLESPLVCVAGVTGSDLQKRIYAIMHHPASHNLNLGRKILLLTAGLAALAAPIATGILSPSASRAQSAQTVTDLSTFEVASVKLTEHGRNADGWSRSDVSITGPGVLTATNGSMEELIRWAYDVKQYQIIGPDWLNSDAASYDIVAKAPPETPKHKIQLMAQALLAERFKLALHRETRTLPCYELVPAKNGPRLQASSSTENSIFSRGGDVKASGVTMAFFAETLSRYIGAPVFDKTGLSKNYDFTFEYAVNDRETDKPSIFTAVEERLGLRLKSVKGPVEVLVIDHAEKVPAAN